ncbi:hypothetical protein ES288_A11G304800v1 [Gossypium darwinii]|nr:hypothetical protein ES288_A11G304800v1 [Gossypium darwinii]
MLQMGTMMAKVSKRNPNILEAGDVEKSSRYNDDIETPKKMMINVKEKSHKNESEMMENQIDEMKIKKSTEWTTTQQPSHHRSSWCRLDRKENFDANMSEMTLGKRKFNHEILVDAETYPITDSPVKKAKEDNDCLEGHANFKSEKVFSYVSSELTQVISAAANWQADWNL